MCCTLCANHSAIVTEFMRRAFVHWSDPPIFRVDQSICQILKDTRQGDRSQYLASSHNPHPLLPERQTLSIVHLLAEIFLTRRRFYPPVFSDRLVASMICSMSKSTSGNWWAVVKLKFRGAQLRSIHKQEPQTPSCCSTLVSEGSGRRKSSKIFWKRTKMLECPYCYKTHAPI